MGSSVTEETAAPTLTLTSHAQSPPLLPPPDLKYDLRSLGNPPKAIRDSFTGLSKRLREHMLSQDEFSSFLDRAEADIKEKMADLVGVDGAMKDQQDQAALFVGIFCSGGKHRSVAFVEELARRKWPSNWAVHVVHRDVHKPRNARQSQRGRGSKRSGASSGALCSSDED